MLAVGFAGPVSADPTGATVTITAGGLAITVPVSAGNLGSRGNTVSTSTISGPLGEVQVNDARGGTTGWVASVISTAFTPPAGPTIPAASVSYTAGPITTVGTATYTANNPANLVGVTAAVTATAVTGTNSATWTPTITVAVPAVIAAGVYTATITHSVA